MSLRIRIIGILRRQWKFRVAILVAALLVLAGAIWSYFQVTERPRVISARRGGEVVFKDVSESVFDYGTLREMRLVLTDDLEFAIHVYDFDTSYYAPGENQFTGEPQFLSVLLERQKDFGESWVVIFAGASFEGTTSKNFDLCRCRIWNLARFMSREGITNLGYWSIPAGEFRLRDGSPDDSTEDSAEIEEEEEEEANRLGEGGLRGQRRLLVVAVKPLQQVTGDSAQAYLNDVVEALAGRGLLPTNYDKGTAKPVALDATDDNNPCPTGRKSVKAKIRTLIERLFRRAR